MTTAQILAATGRTKTWKMQQLFALGHTRNEVATMMGVGYGFAQNVYAAWATAGRSTTAPAAPRAPGNAHPLHPWGAHPHLRRRDRGLRRNPRRPAGRATRPGPRSPGRELQPQHPPPLENRKRRQHQRR